ncbi:hypothetical protein [Aureimonas sp. AU20]|uniref:hypothetical protein n=1 Tax=Aureimonas sp. AU20 TaxID=1349819 RepID=UPI000720B2B1|nr:hypothetical protein [Aureimonas sp. AU20]ALN73575.1 hypothetical protein M673_12685 [Aureimonas sp. AU20]
MARAPEFDLSVQIEAKMDRLQKQMDRADKLVARQFQNMQRSADRSAKAMEDRMSSSASRINQSLSTIGKGLAGALAIGGVGQLVSQYREVVTSIANIGNEARRAGLSTKAFQELQHVATQTRIPMDALVDGMKELSLRADEFAVTGAGSAAEAFRRIGYDATTLKEALKDPSALLVEIVSRMQKLNKAAQIRVADELFGGTGGEQFVELLRHGATGIRTMIAEANSFGLVMDDAFIDKADEVDRKFDLLSKRIGTGVKGAIIEATDALGIFLDRFKEYQDQQSQTLLASRSLAVRSRDDAQRRIDGSYLPEMLLTPLRKQVEASNAEIERIDKALAARGDTAANGINRLGTAADAAANKLGGITPPATSARQAETASMAALSRFNDAEARTIAKKGMLDLIGYAEGTDKGRGYNETLAFGKFTGGDVNLTQMTLNEVLALQKKMLAHPDNKFNSSAVGRYQIVSKTMRGLMGDMGLTGEEFFDAGMQDRMAQQLLRRRGNDLGGLRNEWEGLRRVPDGAISTAMGATTQTLPGRDEGVQTKIDKNKELATSYREIINGAVEMIANSNVEIQTYGMTASAASRLRIEQDLLNQASARGIALSPEQRAQLSQLAAGMAEVENAAEKAAHKQEELKAAQDFLASGVSGFFSSIITGSATAEEALQRMLSMLAEAAIEAALFGKGPMAGLFGGGQGAGILGKLFGFADGGIAANGRPQPLPQFAKGGVSRSAAIFGEAGPEAAVPLPDGRSIPVTLSAPPMPRIGNMGGSSTSNITLAPAITVNVEGGSQGREADEKQGKAIAQAVDAQIRATVAQELRTAMRPGGLMRGGR